MIDIQPIREENKLSQVIDAMKKADDGVSNPTHAVLKDGRIVGAFSFNNVCLQFWLNEECNSRDSLLAGICMNAMAQDRGIESYVIPCRKESPYYPLMERLGYRKIENVDLFYKD